MGILHVCSARAGGDVCRHNGQTLANAAPRCLSVSVLGTLRAPRRFGKKRLQLDNSSDQADQHLQFCGEGAELNQPLIRDDLAGESDR